MSLPRRALRHSFALPSLTTPRPDAACAAAAPGERTLRFYLIKPSRYDDDGFIMRYRWGVIPSNTLAVLAGLLARCDGDCGARIQTVIWDEMVDGVLSAEIIGSIRRQAAADGVELLVGLAGVQTNQYPRARDIALQFRRLQAPVVIGGFHVSSHAPSVEFLCSQGITVVLGEAENTLPALIDDYLRGDLQSRYRVTDGVRAKTGAADIIVPRIEDAPLPVIDGRYTGRFFNPTFATIDTSRGCPFTCSYCSVKNVMGRSMRSRDPGRVVDWVRAAHDDGGIRNLLVVDDDLFRSPAWEPVFRGLGKLRQSGREVSLIIQTDIEAATHGPVVAAVRQSPAEERSRRFVDLAAAAGCFEVFMGFESFEPANLEHTLKFHNEERQDRRRQAPAEDARRRVKERYRRVVDNWHAAGVGVHCGYMIGLPFDGKGCGERAARALTEIGVDIASFFACTPLPGSEDYDRAVLAGSVVDTDFNAYDSTHFVAEHPTLTLPELRREYEDAYRHFYSWRRLSWSLATRHAVPGLTSAARYGMLAQQMYFTYATRRGWHPMMGGIWRMREAGRRQAVTDLEAAAVYA